MIEDCDAETFRALLRFLYSDDFCHVEVFLQASEAASEGSAACPDGRHDGRLQKLLAVSHKYQVERLQLWCEQQLCKCLSVSMVCSVLCKAHLFEAKQLEKASLKFISENRAEVMLTPAYVKLVKEWPDVALKISIVIAGLPVSSVASVLQAAQDEGAVAAGSKRKRAE